MSVRSGGENAGALLSPDLLRSAAEVMEQRGLAQHAYADADGSVCILGAVAVARGYELPPESWSEVWDETIEEPLGEMAALMGFDPVIYSDTAGVDEHDVAAALRWAADRLARHARDASGPQVQSERDAG